MPKAIFAAVLLAAFATSLSLVAEPLRVDTTRGDRMIAAYFESETARLQDACLTDITSLEEWQAKRPLLRQQLLEMLGLDPLPERTDLQATVTGSTAHDRFTVERLHFQSRPGLYVSGNLYLPVNSERPAPAILYVCGHGAAKKDGVSYGNKVTYQHHGGWFARHGYVCLIIDTLQMGEIEGIHHGTYRYDRWWWLNRGYTPAGVEAWNCVRAIDYLQSRQEVDAQRIGVTGRSGGGAYSWWIAAIDDRVQVAVPVAGITDLQNHVVDGCVEGHCDCMFMMNTYGWDYAAVAALVAPRPLLISNTDRDGIFPLDGVVRVHAQVRRIYELYGAGDKLGLQITAGPHKDTQELRVHAFRWFNHHLRGEDGLINEAAVKYFEPEQLQVFSELPQDQANTQIDKSFVAAAAEPTPPSNVADWEALRANWRRTLLEKSFRGWPEGAAADLDIQQVFSVERQGIRFAAFDFTSQDAIRLRLYSAQPAGLERPDLTVLNVLDEQAWLEFLATMRVGFEAELAEETLPPADEATFRETSDMFRSFKWAMAYVAPRGIGPTAWDASKRKQTQHRRRFYLLGQTLDGMRIWDTRRAIQALRSVDGTRDGPLWLQSWRTTAGVALYAALFEPDIKRLDLYAMPTRHHDGPYLLNVSRYLDLPQTVAMVAEHSQVVLYDAKPDDWTFAANVVKQLAWNAKQLQFRKLPESRLSDE